MKNSDTLGIKCSNDKKAEKNFLFYIKFNNKEYLKNNQYD